MGNRVRISVAVGIRWNSTVAEKHRATKYFLNAPRKLRICRNVTDHNSRDSKRGQHVRRIGTAMFENTQGTHCGKQRGEQIDLPERTVNSDLLVLPQQISRTGHSPAANNGMKDAQWT